MSDFHIPYLYNPGVLVGKIPEDIFDHLKKAVTNKKARQQSMRQDLVGSIKEEYLTPRFEAFDQFLHEMFESWCEAYQIDLVRHKLDPKIGRAHV